MPQPKNRRLVTEEALEAGLESVRNAYGSIKNRKFYVASYGTVSEATLLTTASMNAGSKVLSAGAKPFAQSDVGKVVGVRGAGVTGDPNIANDGVLVSTITAVSGGDAVLNDAAATSCSGVPCLYGFPIDDAITAAKLAATAAGGGSVIFPAGRYITQIVQSFGTLISWDGAGRGNSRINVTKVVPSASDLNTAPFLRTQGLSGSSEYYQEINLSNFSLYGDFYACQTGYNADMKMIHIAGTLDSTVERIASYNNPSTALGYDGSVNCLINNNKFINPGRLARVVSATGSPGGSGIGIAISDPVNKDFSMVLRDNFIKGNWTAAGGTGRAGINIEMSKDNVQGDWGGGIRAFGNIIEGMFNGIVDSGGLSTLFQGNQIRKCNNGIRLGTNGISTGATGIDTIVLGNVIEQGISGTIADGSTVTNNGIQITTSGAGRNTRGRMVISNNVIRKNDGPGMLISGSGTDAQGGELPLGEIMVKNNGIRENGQNGIQLNGKLYNLNIEGNQILNNGQKDSANSRNAAIRRNDGTVMVGGRITNNEYIDTQTTPTQVNAMVDLGTVTETGTKVEKNTGDQDAIFSQKSSTTTITSNTSMTDVSAMGITLKPNTVYEITSFIEYSTSAAVGLRLGVNVPSGTSIQWFVTGAGAPDTAMLAGGNTATLAGTGVGVLRSARLQARLSTGATGGAMKLQAAQSPSSTDATVITTKTSLFARKLIDLV